MDTNIVSTDLNNKSGGMHHVIRVHELISALEKMNPNAGIIFMENYHYMECYYEVNIEKYDDELIVLGIDASHNNY